MSLKSFFFNLLIDILSIVAVTSTCNQTYVLVLVLYT